MDRRDTDWVSSLEYYLTNVLALRYDIGDIELVGLNVSDDSCRAGPAA